MNHTAPFLLLALLAMFSIFGCFTKKAPYPKNIDAWIELHFPDQLVVLVSNWNYDIKDLIFTGKKIAVVADKHDPEIQFTLHWSKPTDNVQSLGLDAADVQAKLDTCRADVHRARELFNLLKNNGLQNFSVSSIEQAAYILVFAEPTPALRQHITTVIKTTLDARAEQPQTSIWVEIMEPQFYQTEFKDIVPHAEWQKPGTVFSSNKIMSLNFEWKPGIPVSALVDGWELNDHANRTSRYMEEAYPKALAWAEKNLPKPFYLEPAQMVAYHVEKVPRASETSHLLTIRFSFPFFKAKPTAADSTETAETEKMEPIGYVTGIYDVDQKTFGHIKRTKEF